MVVILMAVAAALLIFLNQEAPANQINFTVMQSDELVTVSIQKDVISYTDEGLATPDTIGKGKTLLPPDTLFLQIEGGNHTQFALYGEG